MTQHRSGASAGARLGPRWPWWGHAILAVAAMVSYALAVRHAAVLAGLLTAGVLVWAAEQAEAAWRARLASRTCRHQPARVPGFIVWACLLVGLAVTIWPEVVP